MDLWVREWSWKFLLWQMQRVAEATYENFFLSRIWQDCEESFWLYCVHVCRAVFTQKQHFLQWHLEKVSERLHIPEVGVASPPTDRGTLLPGQPHEPGTSQPQCSCYAVWVSKNAHVYIYVCVCVRVRVTAWECLTAECLSAMCCSHVSRRSGEFW